MLIICPSCATSYDVELASLQPDGRQVRCVRCRTIWRAAPTQAQRLVAAAAAIAPDHAAAEVFAQTEVSPPAEEYAGDAADAAEWAAPLDDQLMARGSFETLTGASKPAFPEDEPPDEQAVEVEAPTIAPVDLGGWRMPIDVDEQAENGPEPHEDIETVAARRYRPAFKRGRWGWPLSVLQTAILALIVVDGVLVGWRADFVRALPQTASFYAWIGLPVNVRGLAFDGLAITTEQHEGVPILVVEGNIVNDSRQMVDVPRLKFAVRNAARQEIYSWTAVPPRTMLPAHEAVAFRSRLASPPPEARDVLVRFINRRDVLAGAR